MLPRRNILKMVLGGATAAASGMSVKEAAETLGVSPDFTGPDALDDVKPMDLTMATRWDAKHRVTHAMARRLSARRESDNNYPVHIRTKKSWSPAFKQAVYEREILILQEFERRIMEDEAFFDTVAAALGIDVPPREGMTMLRPSGRTQTPL